MENKFYFGDDDQEEITTIDDPNITGHGEIEYEETPEGEPTIVCASEKEDDYDDEGEANEWATEEEEECSEFG